jgi:hypothetical protein
MSDVNDHETPSVPPAIDELLTALRSALANDASPEVRAAGANACRAMLGALDPAALRNAARPPAAPPTSPALGGSPLGAALGALGSIPREQIVEFLVTGLRAFLAPNAPTYHLRPMPVPSTNAGTP